MNTPTLNGRDRGGVWILLFSEVTLSEYNVSTILSPIVEKNKFLIKEKVKTRAPKLFVN